jgi:hypothetical protein
LEKTNGHRGEPITASHQQALWLTDQQGAGGGLLSSLYLFLTRMRRREREIKFSRNFDEENLIDQKIIIFNLN